jgi:hypothetical protein
MSEVRNKFFYFRDSRSTPTSSFNYTKIVSTLFYFLPVILGGLIYIVLRPNSILFYSWLEYFHVYSIIHKIRLNLSSYYLLFPNWFIYSMPNGLWAFSYSAIICQLWFKRSEGIKFFWFTTIPIVCIGYEVMQYLGVIKGTFCLIDLSFCFLGIVLGLTMFEIRRHLP